MEKFQPKMSPVDEDPISSGSVQSNNEIELQTSNLEPNKENLSFDMEKIERDVLSRIININEEGLAYSGMSKIRDRRISWAKDDIEKNVHSLSEIATSIIKLGLLGSFGLKTEGLQEDEKSPLSDKMRKKWVHSRKLGYGGNLWVHILGRDIENVSDGYGQKLDDERESIGVVADISSYKEQIPYTSFHNNYWSQIPDMESGDGMKHGKGRRKHFRFYWGEESKVMSVLKSLDIKIKDLENINYDELVKLLSENTESFEKTGMTREEYQEFIDFVISKGTMENLMTTPGNGIDEGFAVSHRVAPRYFKGFVLHQGLERSTDELVEDLIGVMKKNSMELGKEFFLPIYDMFGNLLWPKKISSDNVSKVLEGSMSLDEATKEGISEDDIKEKIDKRIDKVQGLELKDREEIYRSNGIK